jgi:hypothetical protein
MRHKFNLDKYLKNLEYRSRNAAKLKTKRRISDSYKQELLKTQKREWNYKRRYGVSFKAAERMLKSQNGKCAICSKLISFGGQAGAHVDHHHMTAVIRGILCHNCNRMIAECKESITNLFNAINYLRTFSGWGKKAG